MGRKSNKQLLKEFKKNALTVEKLIKLFRTYPKEALIGSVGHFGEFNSMTSYNFSLRDSYITPNDNWRHHHRETIKVVDICCPDIGPEPI